MACEMNTVKPLIKDTPKEDKPPNKGQMKIVLYKITSKRGQPLCKGQNAGSQMCPLFGGPTVCMPTTILYVPAWFTVETSGSVIVASTGHRSSFKLWSRAVLNVAL